MSALDGKTIFVTGATGFVGGRLIERLFLEHRPAQVRTLVRGYQKVPRIARFPVAMIDARIDDAAAMGDAIRGADVVFHLAHDAGLDRVVRTGVEIIAEAAAAQRARVVNLSSASVYGAALYNPKGGVVEEDTPKGALVVDAAAAQVKRDAEAIFDGARRERGLDVVHLQPAGIYGPFGRRWVDQPLAHLAQGRVALFDQGRAPCNVLYVDDVVEAMLRAATAPDVAGHAFLLTQPRQHTWRDYYAALEAMIVRRAGGTPGPSRLAFVTDDEARALRRAQTKAAARALYSAVTDQSIIVKAERIPGVERSLDLARRKLPGVWSRLTTLRKSADALPAQAIGGVRPRPSPSSSGVADGLPVRLPDEGLAAMQRSRASIASYKAMRLLGYAPAFDLELGMAQVESYARWARLI